MFQRNGNAKFANRNSMASVWTEFFFLLIKEFLDDSALVEASSSKDDEILFSLLISNKELKEKAMPYKKHLRQLKCKREEKFSD